MEQAPNLKTLKNGAVYDLDKGRIVSGKNITTKITEENSIAYHSRRQELKRQRVEAGARAAVERVMPDRFTGEADDWIEAVSEAVTEKALDPDNPKQVDAARFLLAEAGLAERQVQAQGTGSMVTMPSDMARDLLARVLGEARMVIDADVVSEGDE